MRDATEQPWHRGFGRRAQASSSSGFGVVGVVEVEALAEHLAEVLGRSLPARVEVGEIEWWEPN